MSDVAPETKAVTYRLREKIGPRGGVYVKGKTGNKIYVGHLGDRMHKNSPYSSARYAPRYNYRAPRNYYYRGRGDYKEYAGPIIRGLGSVAGGVAGAIGGGPWGAIKGAAMGSGIGGLASSLLGLGDYTVKSNTLLGVPVASSGSMPKIMNTNGRFIFQHKEYIRDIQSTVNFANTVFHINPGLSETFPWLSTIAQNFEQWRPLGMAFCFKSTSGDSLTSSNVALGTVVLATDYNSAGFDFVNKKQMENTYYNSSTKPSMSVLHPIECNPALNQNDIFFVRTGNVPAGQDPRLFDLGKFQIATDGMQVDESVIGELHITYEIELLKPILPDETAIIEGAHFQLNGAIDASHPLGSSGASTLYNTINGFAWQSANQWLFTDPPPNANYLLTMHYTGATGNTCEPASPVYTSDISAISNYYQNGTLSQIPNAAAGSGTKDFVCQYAFTIGTLGLTSLISYQNDGVFPTGNVTGEAIITRLPNHLSVI